MFIPTQKGLRSGNHLMQEVEQLVKMVNQIAENFSFHDDAVDRIVDHLQRFWAPSMQKKLIESGRLEGAELKPAARDALKRLESA